jgi:hypothetical protein
MLLSARLTRAASPAGNPPADLLDQILQEQWSTRLDIVADGRKRSPDCPVVARPGSAGRRPGEAANAIVE